MVSLKRTKKELKVSFDNKLLKIETGFSKKVLETLKKVVMTTKLE